MGICLVKNDDRFLERVIRNVVEFCDEIILADHCSTDGTSEIGKRLASEFEKITYNRISHPSQSHDFISTYANTKTWIFGVDGDEIYDPVSLRKLKDQLLSGRFSDTWQVFGKTFHVTEFDFEGMSAKGFMARPSRPINKLYNFSLIKEWRGPCSERLHHGEIVFVDPERTRQDKDESESYLTWEESAFKCLHAAFVWRSSLDKGADSPRPNIEEIRQMSRVHRVVMKFKSYLGFRTVSKTKNPYRRGPLVEMPIDAFFRNGVRTF